MSQWIALLLVPPVNVYELPTARWTVPSIFSSNATFLHVALDPRVAADAELPQPTRAVVGVEYFEQELLSQLRRRDDDPAVLELEAHPGDLAPVVDGRELRELDHAVRRILDGRL